jgi:hypothetical protein
MANANAPFGLRPTRTVGGSHSGSLEVFTTPAGDGTAIYIGDAVTKTGNGTGQTVNGVMYPDCVIAATTDIIDGVVVAVLADTEASLPVSRRLDPAPAAGLHRPEHAVRGPGGQLRDPVHAERRRPERVAVRRGRQHDHGPLRDVLDNATEATTNTLVCKIVAPINRPNLAIGLANRWLVRINRHRLVDQLIGV